MSAFQAVLTALITTGLSGSPAANTFCGGLIILVRSAWINIRHTVGGAQIDGTPSVSLTDISCLASNRTEIYNKIVASPISAAKTFDQAWLAQPGEATVR